MFPHKFPETHITNLCKHAYQFHNHRHHHHHHRGGSRHRHDIAKAIHSILIDEQILDITRTLPTIISGPWKILSSHKATERGKNKHKHTLFAEKFLQLRFLLLLLLLLLSQKQSAEVFSIDLLQRGIQYWISSFWSPSMRYSIFVSFFTVFFLCANILFSFVHSSRYRAFGRLP